MTTAREIAERICEDWFGPGSAPRMSKISLVDDIESALLAERRRAIEALDAARKALRTAGAYNHTCDLGGSCAVCDQSTAALELIDKALASPREET
jgi:hypothetical protein